MFSSPTFLEQDFTVFSIIYPYKKTSPSKAAKSSSDQPEPLPLVGLGRQV